MDDTKTTDTPVAEETSPPTESPQAGEQNFEAADFQNVGTAVDQLPDSSEPNLDVIMDVPVTLSLEVGRTKMSVGKLLRLSQGTVVELDRLASDPLDVLVNGQLVARGEIVVINDKFGIRLVDVIAPADQVDADR